MPDIKEYKYAVDSADLDGAHHKIASFKLKPLISIVMPVYNVDVHWLSLAIESVRCQVYENWELCIADDCSTNESTLKFLKEINDDRIKVIYLEENEGISGASNKALSLANGEYIALLDNDDELTVDALYQVVKVINDSNPDMIYSDEDKITMDGECIDPHFKPDYSSDMILSQNYICHLSVFRKAIIDKIGGFRIGYEGSQDHDLVLRFVEQTDKIVHIPKILYHWRMIPGSTAINHDGKSYAQTAGVRAVADAMRRREIDAVVSDGRCPGTYSVKPEINGNPLVSIIIPFKDKPELLDLCIGSILKNTSYQNFEIIGISNNSELDDTFKTMEKYTALDERVQFYTYDHPFNFSELNNYAVELSSGEHLLLLNNDIEVITNDWLEALLGVSQRPDVGAVGGLLFYPDNKIQHAGVIIGIGGVAGHSHKFLQESKTGYMCRPYIKQNVSAVTGACLMIKKKLYMELGGLDEENLSVAFNDVDFCLRILEHGYNNVYVPECRLYHHESVSRGYEDTKEKIDRFEKEISYMKKRHAKQLASTDKYYNVNFTLDSEEFNKLNNMSIYCDSDLPQTKNIMCNVLDYAHIDSVDLFSDGLLVIKGWCTREDEAISQNIIVRSKNVEYKIHAINRVSRPDVNKYFGITGETGVNIEYMCAEVNDLSLELKISEAKNRKFLL